MTVVAVDTIVLIRAIREEPDPKDPKAVARAKALIKKLQDDKIPIVLPSVALGEYLAGTPTGDIAEHVQTIDKNFVVEPFDALAALYAGEIWRKFKPLMAPAQYGTLKQCVKSDCWIFATALAKTCSILYAHDAWFRRIARHYPQIKVRGIPKLPEKQAEIDESAYE